LGRSPQEVLLVGIVPVETRLGIGLSPVVRDVVPAAVAAVVRELERLGYAVKKRESPGPPEVWWEKP
ncbi:MAG TPA: hydrogenase maturation protease, partial [Thermoanaerobaculia bacterium]|nr:hydrogenase maturation protease [Thermoanaerobaculia bacterium]